MQMPSMQMPPAMAYAKGPSFMQAQQQRMEVTVPVPEARVRPSLPVTVHFSDGAQTSLDVSADMIALVSLSPQSRSDVLAALCAQWGICMHRMHCMFSAEEAPLSCADGSLLQRAKAAHERAQVGAIIGKGGEVISQLKSVIGVKIRISDRDDFVPGTRNRKVTISGAAEAVQIAQVCTLCIHSHCIGSQNPACLGVSMHRAD